MRVYLIGYMACGKSSLGRKLAGRLHYEFVDTDAVIEREEGAEINDIMKYEGEEYFRGREAEILRKVSESDNVVISTGGGTPMWNDNMTFIKENGRSVYIRRPVGQIASRLTPYGKSKRPKLRHLSDEEVLSFMTRNLAEREPVYMLSDLVLDCTHLSDDDILRRIIGFVGR